MATRGTRRTTRTASIALAVLGSVAWHARARAEPVAEPPAVESETSSAPPVYRALAAEGFEEFQRHNYQEALALFERAYAVHPAPRMLRAIAKCLFELRRYAEAVVVCDRALAAVQDALGEGLRGDVRELRERAFGFTGTARFVIEPASADVIVDGRRVALGEGSTEVRIDVGRHVVEASAPGRVAVRREVVVDAGRRVDVRLDLTGASSDVLLRSRAGTYALVGAGGALAAGALLSSSLWFVGRSRAVDTCNEAAAQGARCDNGSAVATQRDLSVAAVLTSTTLLIATAVVFVIVARGGSSLAGAAAISRGPGFSW